MSVLSRYIPATGRRAQLAVVLLGLLLLCLCLAVALEEWLLLALPVAALGGLAVLADWRYALWGALGTMPFAINMGVAGGMHTDLVAEPLLMFLTLVFLYLAAAGRLKGLAGYTSHPVFWLLVAGWGWALVATLFTVDAVVSIKFLLQKIWYIVPLFLMVPLAIRRPEGFRGMFWVMFGGMLLLSVYCLVRHAPSGFSFGTVNRIVSPFVLNHVIYSTIIIVFLPFVWYARRWYAAGSMQRLLLNFGFACFILSILTSYTRASWLGLAVIVGGYYMVRYYLTLPALLVGVVVAGFATWYVLDGNRYHQYAPDFESTISYYGDIEGHLAATAAGTDVSGMERVYRWVAAKNMIAARPITGFGPSTFHPAYKDYTVLAFETYVSDNPERSTTHNYFLLMLCEQGIPGMALFALLVGYLLHLGTHLYHTLGDPYRRSLALAATLSILVFLFHLLLNDLVEDLKSVTPFYLSASLLVLLDVERKAASPAQAAGQCR